MQYVTAIPEGAVRIPTRPFALGEATGHHHSVADTDAVEMYEKDGEIYVRILEDVPLTHQEHKPVVLPSGAECEIRIATEVTDYGRSPVRD